MSKQTYLTLNNGVKIPQFGIGVFLIDGEDNTEKAVLEALKMGYRHIDTAHAYFNEKGVGAAVRKSGIPRNEIFVTSKLWPTEYGEGATLKAIDKMLERLQLDYIDLVYLHQPAGDYFGAYKDLEKAVKMGKIRALGISDFDYDDKMLDEFVEKVNITPVALQIECHPYAQRQDMRKKAAKYNMIVETWFPLGGYIGKSTLMNDKVINEIAKTHNKSAAQILLRWGIQEGFSLIPGSKNAEHIKENINIFDFSLSDSEMQKIRSMNKDKRFYEAKPDDLKNFLNFHPAD